MTRRIVFWSSVQSGGILTGLIRSLRGDGYVATHRYHLSNQSYRIKRGRLGRIWLRTRMYGFYPVQLALFQLLNRRPGIDVVCTNTFYAPLITALLRPRSRKVVHLIYDLFPDALIFGAGRQAGMRIKLAEKLVAWTFKRCDANVFLGEKLLAHAEKRFGSIPNATIIPVGVDGADFEEVAIADVQVPTTDFLYCGNMGFLHDTHTLAEGMREVLEASDPPHRARFSIRASGAQLNKMSGAVADLGRKYPRSIELAGSLPTSEWQARMRKAQVALVTMIPDAGKVVMPSKTYSAMAAGQALLAIAPEDSDLAQLIRQHDCGWIVPPGQPDVFAEIVERILKTPTMLRKKRENALQAARAHYDVRVLARRWEELFEGITSS